MSGRIHSSAIVDPTARLGTDVVVGPYAIIESGCVIGDFCEIRAHAVICANTVLGPQNQVGYGAVLGAEPQDYSFKGGDTRVEIGARNKIREYVTIHRATTEGGATRVGDDNFLMGGSHVGHDAVVGNHAILANNSLLGGFSQVGDRAFLGGATIVHQHVRIGTLVMTRGGTRLSKEVPPYFMAVSLNQVSGLNRVGLRRAGFSQALRQSLQAAYEMIYRSNLNVSQAVAELRAKFHQPEVVRLLEFISTSKRGICRDRMRFGGSDFDE